MIDLNEFYPIMVDTQREYRTFRTMGKSRAEAINAMMADAYDELKDDDERTPFMIGLALALCKKRELTVQIRDETLREIECFKAFIEPNASVNRYLSETEQLLCDISMLGDEAAYHQRNAYVPDWEVGDLFAHTITHPNAAVLGISGWMVLFYKVGEYINRDQKHCQLVYISLCPPGKEPTTCEELRALGFVRMMKHSDKYDYLAQITVKSKKDECHWELRKLGNFADITPPKDATIEDPRVTMPLWNRLKKSDPYLIYEELICKYYKLNGMSAQ